MFQLDLFPLQKKNTDVKKPHTVILTVHIHCDTYGVYVHHPADDLARKMPNALLCRLACLEKLVHAMVWPQNTFHQHSELYS